MLLALGALAALAGCLPEWPVFHPPVWSPDGRALFYALARPDGKLAVHRVDLATGEADELAEARLEGEVAAMAPSPKGDRIAIAVHKRPSGGPPALELGLAAPDSSVVRPLWTAPSSRGACDLCWTPDGTAIVVAAQGLEGSALWLVPCGEAKPARLFDTPGQVRAPSLSSDGRQVAFVAQAKAEGLWSLYVAALDGSRCKAMEQGIFRTWRPGYWPAWSPRGEAVAYVAERQPSDGFAEVWLWDPRAGRSRVLARTLAGACLAPAWSPAADAVAFVRLPFGPGPAGPGSGGRPADIAVVDPAGASVRPLVADGLSNLMPAWSPDGKTIAFATCADPALAPHVVRLVDTATGKVRPLRDTPFARFLLAQARSSRGDPAAFRQALDALPGISEPREVAYATIVVARTYVAQADWAPAARHAEAAAAQEGPWRREALGTLAKAHLRLGDPKAALAPAEALAAAGDPALRDRIRQGLDAAAALEPALKDKPSPELSQRLASVWIDQLDNPRKALDLLYRLLDGSPDHPQLRRTAELVFAASERLGARAASYRVLQRAAAILGEKRISPDQALLLAETAAANGQGAAAVERLAALPPKVLLRYNGRVAAIYLQAGEDLLARGSSAAALAAFRSGAAALPCPEAARNALEAGKLLAEGGDHPAATRCLLAALSPQAETATIREALRLLTTARLRRVAPLAYDAAYAGELLQFGYYAAALALAEQLMSGLPAGDPGRELVRPHLAAAFDRLVACQLAREDVAGAQTLVQRWLAVAGPRQDLPRALAALASCQRLTGQKEALAATLSRIVLECPDSPEAADARRELLRLGGGPGAP